MECISKYEVKINNEKLDMINVVNIHHIITEDIYLNMNQAKREIWVDNVKVIACILVVLGHFFQSMTKALILPDTN
jgi:hypothetical protein